MQGRGRRRKSAADSVSQPRHARREAPDPITDITQTAEADLEDLLDVDWYMNLFDKSGVAKLAGSDLTGKGGASSVSRQLWEVDSTTTSRRRGFSGIARTLRTL